MLSEYIMSAEKLEEFGANIIIFTCSFMEVFYVFVSVFKSLGEVHTSLRNLREKREIENAEKKINSMLLFFFYFYSSIFSLQ